ncbi:arginine--tRNA ligase [Candidatus Woesearchaeota archaeon]|nr:MAG: arginine--tRNA ligase [Candidatus Woesearchaeota archaeon]
MFEEEILSAVKEHVKQASLERPPDLKLGDFALPCFALARELKMPPAKVAQELAEKIRAPDFVDRIEARGPYVNFFLNTTKMAAKVLSRIEVEREHYGSNHSGKGMHALIEHTSINPNASPHVGRARNAMIGDSIARMLRFEGFETRVHYFVNDVGKQIAMLVLACEEKEKVSFEELLKIYIDVNERSEKDPSIEKSAFELLSRFEAGDREVHSKFRRVVDICVEGQRAIFERLGITFDHFDYESDYILDGKVANVLDRLKKTGKVEKDEDGRWVLDLEGFDLPLKSPVLVLTRNDGTSLYALRDIAYNLDKNAWAKGRNIVVLGEDQKTYLQQVCAALSLLGESAPRPVHYSFVLLSTGKMSTRKGNVVLLEDFMKQALERARSAMQREFGEEKARRVERSVAFGAVKFAILKVSNEKTATFDWERALAFEGDTSVYCQYANARIHSIFRKAGVHDPRLPESYLFDEPSEHALISELSMFPGIVAKALQECDPSILAHYVLGVARAFSEFYHSCPVLDEGDIIRSSRLALCNATSIVIENCLGLLGIDAPREM